MNDAKAVEALTDQQIDDLWLYRTDLHGGDLMPQLRDFARAVLALQQQPEPVANVEQQTLAGIETVSDADNQWFGDMMILQVLADSDCPNFQEREVLLRWIEHSQPPSVRQGDPS